MQDLETRGLCFLTPCNAIRQFETLDDSLQFKHRIEKLLSELTRTSEWKITVLVSPGSRSK